MKKLNDINILNEMKNLIFHDGDVRPVWIGEYDDTDVIIHKAYFKWAKEHYSLYKGFFYNIKNSKNLNILDLGCGSGYCTYNLKKYFNDSNIIGIDIDNKSIEFANKHNFNEGIKYECLDVTNVEYENIDIIFLIETLEHIKHDKHYLLIDNCLKFLNENGLLCVCTPNEETFINAERGHVGILTQHFFEFFKKRYDKNIVSIEYYDNKRLLTENYTTNNNTDSHFKIILKK